MGVTGLWRLIEPAGKPVPVETLENKVLAVDISIWLHQMVKGYQDAKGAPLPNAHLMGLFQRLCKLLYFRIKPVFVFDGAFPELKKETIAKRQDHKAKYNSESERIKRELALLLSKRTVVSTLLGKQISPSKQQSSTSGNNDDLFKLPALPQTEEESESESEDERSSSSIDLHTVDLESDNFKQLPVKEKYDILIDLKETRKQNSWGRLQELPKKSDNFSDFQMQRLLKRRKVQECIQETEKEMGDGGMSLNDIEFLLNEEGIDTKINTIPAKRIASNPTSKFILIKDVKQALADALKREEGNKPGPSPKAASEKSENEDKPKVVDELEEDLQKAIQMSLECSDEQSTDNNATKADDSWTSCMTDTDSEASGTDSEEEDGFEQPDIFCAKAYIMQYSDFTHSAINEIVTEKRKNKDKHKIPKVDQIIDEINKEKSVIVDNVEISSSSDESVSEVHESNINNQADIKSMPLQNNHEDLDDSLNATQKSVICVENPVPVIDIVSLNNSTEESDISIDKKPEDIKKKKIDLSDEDFKEAANSTQETDSSDSDFEEVPDVESKATKPVVELTLNVDEVPDDDIFADVFSDKKDLISKDKLQEEHSTFDDVFTVKKDFISKDTLQKDQNDLNDSSIKTDSIFKAPQPIMTKVHIENKEISKVVATKEPEDVEMKEMNTAISINKEDNSKAVSTEINSKQVTKLSGNSISTNINKGEMLEPKENNAPKENDVPKKILTTENLNTMAEEMDDQQQVLLQEKARLDRVGRNITEQMTKEAQELLQIFGIPYLVAPMEAEAQCAFLESVKLTDGTITDDSDIWLFGGRTVYKNFFNQKKHVLQFQAERIETSFNLCREQLVLLALLVGSDYTTGVAGVGPVTAMEILASFPFSKRQLLSETTKQERYGQIIKGLQEFKQWVKAGKRTDNTSLKKKLKNVTLTEDFPSVRIVQAYLDPNVEKSDDKFAWGELDITILRDYTKAKFGWSQNKLDEIIKPVLKRVVERKTQRSMQDFFKRKIDFQSLEHQMSKRVKAAVQRMGPENKELGEIEVENNDTSEKSKPAAKRKAPSSSRSKAGPSAPKQKKDNIDNILLKQGVKVVSVANEDGNSEINIKIQKTDRFQEVIPQREKDKKSLLENKLKAIELFRKTKLDRKKKTTKRRPLKPKDKAELSESDTD